MVVASRSCLTLFALCLASTTAFVPPAAGRVVRTDLQFGIPSWMDPTKKDENDKKEDTSQPETKKIGLSGVLQLITAGAGAPFLGDFEGVDEETGKFMFSLEANNLVDENGNSKQTSMPYFENGWVDENEQEFQWPWQKKKD